MRQYCRYHTLRLHLLSHCDIIEALAWSRNMSRIRGRRRVLRGDHIRVAAELIAHGCTLAYAAESLKALYGITVTPRTLTRAIERSRGQE